MNHKWKDNVCVNCGLNRIKRSWRRRMAIVGSKDYYQYGSNWWYGFTHEDCKSLVKSIGFERPDCKK